MDPIFTRQHLEKNLGIGLILITISIAPRVAIDPINLPKFVALFCCALITGGQLLMSRVMWDFKKFHNVYFVCLAFATLMATNLLLAPGDIWSKLFGVSGRNTGILTYIALLIMFMVALVVTKGSDLRKITKYIWWIGFVSLAYGVVQALGLDPFDWSNPYSPVFGFLGNPNFHSSFIAMFGVMTFTYCLFSKNSLRARWVYQIITVLCLVSIYTTKSQQGFLVFALGVQIPIYMFLRSRLNKIQGFAMSFFVLALGFVSILGMLQIGPLTKLLYKDSVTYRGDYWRAGWEMARENPIFGIGFDQYGVWYRRSRSIEATLRRGPEFTSNAAHNVLIDLAASGGFILLFVYLGFVFLTVKSIRDILKYHNQEKKEIIALIGMWVAYQAQSIISINQIGIAIWGWVLGGLIIGYATNISSANSLDSKSIKNAGPKIKQPSVQKIGAIPLLYSLLFLLIGLIISGPIFLNSILYKNALESSIQTRIVNAAYLRPYEEARMGEVAIILSQNNLQNESLSLIRKLVSRYPDSFGGWRLISQLEKEGSKEQKRAILEMKRLDPLNPELK